MMFYVNLPLLLFGQGCQN